MFVEMLRSQLSANADAHFQAGADKDDIIVSQYDTMTHFSARSALPTLPVELVISQQTAAHKNGDRVGRTDSADMFVCWIPGLSRGGSTLAHHPIAEDQLRICALHCSRNAVQSQNQAPSPCCPISHQWQALPISG